MTISGSKPIEIPLEGISPEKQGEMHTYLATPEDLIKNDLRSRLGELEYKIWLSDLEIKAEGEEIRIYTSSCFKREKISERYWKLLTEISTWHFPEFPLSWAKEPFAVENKQSNGENGQLVKQDQDFEKKPADKTEILPETKKEVKSLPYPIRQVLQENTLDNFLEIPENKLASRFITKALEQPGVVNPIYLYGSVGVGKTHLLHAYVLAYRSKVPFAKIEYLTPDDFVSDFTRALQAKADRNFRTHYRSVDALLIDDIQFFMGKEKSSQEFFHVFNAIHASGKQMIFTSDRDPRELEQLDDRLKSRISSSAIIEIKTPDVESKKKLIDFFSARQGVNISDEVSDFLSRNLPNDIRQLLGVIRYLSTLNSLNGLGRDSTSITIDYCREHLKQLQNERPDKDRYHPEKILYAVCAHIGMSIKDLKSSRKTKQISRYRQMAMFLLRRYTDLSLPEIGFSLGGRTISSVSYGIDKIGQELESDHPEVLNEELMKIIRKADTVAVF